MKRSGKGSRSRMPCEGLKSQTMRVLVDAMLLVLLGLWCALAAKLSSWSNEGAILPPYHGSRLGGRRDEPPAAAVYKRTDGAGILKDPRVNHDGSDRRVGPS